MLSLNRSISSLNISEKKKILEMRKQCLSDILHSTTLATSGHPGGSCSSLDLLLLAYALNDIRPDNFLSLNRDRLIVSHGHISPAVYSVLACYGFFDSEDMIVHFRRAGSVFSGHIEHHVFGVEWGTGNLGQGLSVACGISLAQRSLAIDKKVFVFMGDGEQQKGQIAEACRFAVKYSLRNIIAIVDLNEFQIGGHTQKVMPQNFETFYRSLGWNVVILEDGHDHDLIHKTYCEVFAYQKQANALPTVILSKTVMGHGISFMSHKCDFHGKVCNREEHVQAMKELKMPNHLEVYQEKRRISKSVSLKFPKRKRKVLINQGEAYLYSSDTKTDNRSAYGRALVDLARLNNLGSKEERTPIVALSCDLEGSVKLDQFHKLCPEFFFEGGIQEHNTVVLAGAMSKEGFQVFFSTFGIFGIDEVYNQQRLNAFNETNLKTVCTHLGLSVGEDGPTHQNIDYIGLLKNLFFYKIFIPADPNQTDRIIRYVAGLYGNVFVGMGREKSDIILNEKGDPFFRKDYSFQEGKADLIRDGNDATVLSYGSLLIEGLKAHDQLLLYHKVRLRVLNMASIVPIDRDAILRAAEETSCIIVLEDHHVETGLGSMVAQILAKNRKSIFFRVLGIAAFSSSGKAVDLYEKHHLTSKNVIQNVLDFLSESDKKSLS